MVNEKYYKKDTDGTRTFRHYDLKCMACGLVTHDIPIRLVEAMEESPTTQELRCSKGCNTRGTLKSRPPNDKRGDKGMTANWELIEVPEAHVAPGSFEYPIKAKAGKHVDSD